MNDEIMRGRCATLVIALVGKDLAPLWWSGQNRAFGFKTPEEVAVTDLARVYSYLMSMSGVEGA